MHCLCHVPTLKDLCVSAPIYPDSITARMMDTRRAYFRSASVPPCKVVAIRLRCEVTSVSFSGVDQRLFL
jgi:hypothetical protein